MIRLNGLPVSEGIGIGPSQSDSSFAGSQEPALDASSEQLRFDKALAMAVEQVSGMPRLSERPRATPPPPERSKVPLTK